MHAPKMIKVDEATHARLAQLAAEHGTTIGGYVGELVGSKRTQADWDELARQAADYMREHFGFDPTPEEKAAYIAEYQEKMAAIEAQRLRRA
jgi:hypothetical protein